MSDPNMSIIFGGFTVVMYIAAYALTVDVGASVHIVLNLSDCSATAGNDQVLSISSPGTPQRDWTDE